MVSPFIIVLTGLGHFYDVMDASGWSMEVAASVRLPRRRAKPQPLPKRYRSSS